MWHCAARSRSLRLLALLIKKTRRISKNLDLLNFTQPSVPKLMTTFCYLISTTLLSAKFLRKSKRVRTRKMEWAIEYMISRKNLTTTFRICRWSTATTATRWVTSRQTRAARASTSRTSPRSSMPARIRLATSCSKQPQSVRTTCWITIKTIKD